MTDLKPLKHTTACKTSNMMTDYVLKHLEMDSHYFTSLLECIQTKLLLAGTNL